MSEVGAAEIDRLVDEFFSAVSAGDLVTLERLYSPEVEVWHNYDDVAQTRSESLRLLAYLHRAAGPLRYRDVRRQTLPDGVVQQHVVELDGVAAGLRMPAMLRIYCDRGQITRIEEYVDPGPLNQRLSTTVRK